MTRVNETLANVAAKPHTEESRLRLLVAEDQTSPCGLAAFFRAYGAVHVETVGSAAGALEVARAEGSRQELFVIDDLLPPSSGKPTEYCGLDIIPDLKRHQPQALVVVFTDGTPERRAEALRLGAFRVFTKPPRPEILTSLLDYVADYRHLSASACDPQELIRLLSATNAIFGCHSLKEVEGCIVSGLRSIGFDRVRLYVMSGAGHALRVKAHGGMKPGYVGAEWELTPESAERLWSEHAGSHILAGAAAEWLTAGEPLNGEAGGGGCVCLPLTEGQELLALVVADNAPSGRAISRKELALLTMFAPQAASALHAAKLLEERQRQVEQLGALHRTTLAVTEERAGDTLLQTLIEQAVQLLKAQGGGIYKYFPDRAGEELRVIYDFRHPENRGKALRADEGLAGRLVASGEPFVSIESYAEWEGRSALAVPLKWEGEIVGVVYVDDRAGRLFTPDEAELLNLFTRQAASALVNADLIARDSEKVRGLMRLSQATKEIMSNLGEKSLEVRITQIAQYVTEILDAEVCYIPLVRREGVLGLEASFGHRPGTFDKNREFKIQSGMKTGLIGHIASEGQVFNEHGLRLREHTAVRGVNPGQHLPSGKCRSLLAVPLKKLHEGGEKLLGLLCAENKRCADPAGPTEPGFSDADEWMLQVFAEAVVVALETANLVSQLGEQKDRLDRLVSSSPTAIIAVNNEGIVTLFNDQAGRILGYAPKDALGMPVADLYADPSEPRNIGRALHLSRDGRLTNYETTIKSKSGKHIPIKHSSTWIYDAENNRAGSVGFFEDSRPMELLLRLSSIVTHAGDLREGLRELVELAPLFLPHSFCRVLVLGEGEELLTVEAVHFAESASGKGVKPCGTLPFSKWPGLREWLKGGRARLVQGSTPSGKSLLGNLTKEMSLARPLRSLYIMPLRVGNKPLGLIEFGELEEARPFTEFEKSLAEALADTATTLINLFHLHHLTERSRQLQTALWKASQLIRADADDLFHKIVRIAVELVGGTSGGLYIYDPLLNELGLEVAYGLSEESKGSRLRMGEGLIGEVAQEKEPKIAADYGLRSARRVTGALPILWTMAAVPLINEPGDVEAVLFVGSNEERQPLSSADLDALVKFAAQASIALQISRLLSQEQRTLSRLSTLNRINDYVQATRDLEKMLHALLTGVTASYGLQLNRAALLLFEEDRDTLVGRMAIGHLKEKPARADWLRDDDRQSGVRTFEHYIQLLDSGSVPQTPLTESIRQLRFRLSEKPGSLFYNAVRKRQADRVKHGEAAALPDEFVEIFKPGGPLVVVPLEVRGRIIGLLVADNKFTHAEVTNDDLKLLMTFANNAAITIDNFRLSERDRLGRERLGALFQASGSVVATRDPRRVLQKMVEQPPVSAGAAWVRIILIDEKGRASDQFCAGASTLGFSIDDPVRPDGISMKVMRSGQVEIIPDTSQHRDPVNPFMLKNGIGAALCFPLIINGAPRGVMWINYFEPRRFEEFEVNALRLYVNQGASTYANALQLKGLERLNQSARAIAQSLTPIGLGSSAVERVLMTIVEEASVMAHADSSTIWSYDQAQEKFIPDELRAIGITNEDLKVFRDLEPWPRGTTYKVLQDSWLAVNDTDSQAYPFIREDMRKHLHRSKVRAFQGITLKVGAEPVAVLYVGYNQPRSFTAEERGALENFATHAALTLKNARLLDQLGAAKKAAQVIAEVTTLGDDDRILETIVEGTMSTTRCDAVVLYAYDSIRGRWKYPPTWRGVEHPELAWPEGAEPLHPLVNTLSRSTLPYAAERVAEDMLLNGTFVRNEGIESCLALPLLAAGICYGVMFVNYHQRHRFRSEELAETKLFADHAAVAVRNAQLFEKRAKQLKEQQELVLMSEVLLRANSESEVMDYAVKTAAKLLEADFCNIVLPNRNGQLTFRAGFGWEKVLISSFRLASGNGSQSGYTIMHRRPVRVYDYDDRAGRDFDVPPIVAERGIKSGLSVPMFRGKEVIGSMLVHTRTRRRFDDDAVKLLELIANETALALESLLRFKYVLRQSAYLSALYKGSRQLAAIFGAERKEVLRQILLLAVEGLTSIEGPKAVLATIQLYNEKANELVLESVYPPEAHPDLVEKIKERRSLDARLCGAAIGFTGMAVLKHQPYLVNDVSEGWARDIYVVYDKRTKSELVVPLFHNGQVIGVLNVESDQLNAFDGEDLEALKALSDLAVIAIVNAEQFADLKETKRRVDSSTALAWMGMLSSKTHHLIQGKAVDIRNQVFYLRRQAEKQEFLLPEWIQKSLLQIEQQAIDIMKEKAVPSLSDNKEVRNLELNEAVNERLNVLWDDVHKYKQAKLKARPDPRKKFFVRASTEWLVTAVDILIDNAFEAVKPLDEKRRRIWVETFAAGDEVELLVTDAGPGIPDHIREYLFLKPVEGRETGMGMGLLIAQAIVEAYGGKLGIKRTDSGGTSMAIWLPLQAT